MRSRLGPYDDGLHSIKGSPQSIGSTQHYMGGYSLSHTDAEFSGLSRTQVDSSHYLNFPPGDTWIKSALCGAPALVTSWLGMSSTRKLASNVQ